MRHPTLIRLAAFAALLCVSSAAFGQNTRSKYPSFVDFRSGDLIFQDLGGSQSAAIRAATGSNYTHMGIVRLFGNEPTVIEAIGPVKETSLKDFIERGGGRYSVYRVNGLSKRTADAVIRAAWRDIGKPYDPYFRPDGAAIYCSELVHRAFGAAGISLGTVQRVGQLNVTNTTAASLVNARWQSHPDCKGVSRAICIARLDRQDIITPVSISKDTQLTEVFSNLDR